MTLTIGRCGLDVDLDNPRGVRWNGNRVSLEGDLVAPSVIEAKVLRRQLLAHVLSDMEPEIPVTWSEDGDLDGFARLLSANISHRPLSLIDGCFDFSAELEYVERKQAPTVTWRTDGADRTGIPGGVTAAHLHGVPNGIKGYTRADASTVYVTRTGPGGVTRVYLSSGYTSSQPEGMLDPANWYDGSPEMWIDGYQDPSRGLHSIGNSTDWQARTSLVRVTASSSASYTIRLYFPNYATPANWATTPYDIQIGAYLSGAFRVMTVSHLQLMQLTPELMDLRLVGFISTAATNDQYRLYVDLRLRRGSFIVECTITSNGLSANQGVKDNAAVGYTAVAGGGGYAKTTDDGDANRLVICYGQTANVGSVASGHLYTNSATTQSLWGFGCELGGGSSASPNQDTDIRDQYFAATSSIVRLAR